MTDKVIEFPKDKVVRDIPEEHLKARQAKADQKFADSVVDELSGFLLTELDNYNVEVENKQFAKDFILVVDALRAAVYRSLALDHHLHSFIDENITLISDGLDGMSKDEIKEKIDGLMKELQEAKNKVDNEGEE